LTTTAIRSLAVDPTLHLFSTLERRLVRLRRLLEDHPFLERLAPHCDNSPSACLMVRLAHPNAFILTKAVRTGRMDRPRASPLQADAHPKRPRVGPVPGRVVVDAARARDHPEVLQV